MLQSFVKGQPKILVGYHVRVTGYLLLLVISEAKRGLLK